MLTSSKYYDYLIWCILRSIIYQYIFIFAFTNLSDLPKSSLEFIEKLEEFCGISKIKYPKFIPDEVIPFMPIYQKCMYIFIVLAILAVLGFKFFQFICGVLVIGTSCIFYHPLKPSTLKPGEEFSTYNLKYPWIDTLLTSIFGFAMIINSLWNCPESIFKNNDDDHLVYLEEDEEEYKKTHPESNKHQTLKEKKNQ